jgi:MFS family permease
MLFTFLVIFGTGFIFPNCFAKALEIFPQNLGLASAVIGSSGLIGASLISNIVSHIHSYNSTSLGSIFFIEVLFCFGAYKCASHVPLSKNLVQ